MNLAFSLDFWDVLLILVVSIQSTVLAYIYHPEWKAFMLTLPFPFTVAVLAVEKPVNSTNMLGLLLLLFFSHIVRILHSEWKINIFMAIISATFSYCILGIVMSRLLPDGDLCFWISSILVLSIAVICHIMFLHKDEPGQKSMIPVWCKLAVIVLVVLFLIILKKSLSGFVTVFPMVGVVAAYEARKSLRTVSRQIPVVMLTLGPMIITIYLFQNAIGIYFSLLLGWTVFLILLFPSFRRLRYAKST